MATKVYNYMVEEIENRVAKSGLIIIDFEEKFRKENAQWEDFDLKDFLIEGTILREKDFRDNLKNHNWEKYRGKFIHLFCSADAILPGWAFLLPIIYLNPIAKKVVYTEGRDIDKIDEVLEFIINNLDLSDFEGERIIVKGCSNISINQKRYLQLLSKIQNVVKSIMYGEPCSTVPLFKRK